MAYLSSVGVVRQCDKSDLQVISPLFAVPKRSGGYRLVHDVHVLNRHLSPPYFKQEDIRTVIDLIQPGDHMITLDLSKCFHHIPVHVDDQRYLGFCLDGRYYKFTCLNFGLSASPYYNHKVLREVVKHLRLKGLRVVLFVDDFILMSQPGDIQSHTQILLETLSDLGFFVNEEKSNLIPSSKVRYIGYDIDTSGVHPVIRIPRDRVRRLRHAIRRSLKQDSITARNLAKIAGQCVSMTQVIAPGKLLLRNTYRLLGTCASWNSK